MTHLVDANVLSEPTKPVPSRKVVDWLSRHEGTFAVDAIVLGELCMGVLALPGGRKRARLEQWFAAVVETIDCIPWDAAISRRWARLVVDLRRKGLAMPLLDGMTAATALEHDLTVVTRKVGDFRKAGVNVVDPFV
jgi:predicted nucleic acid-binding protein